MKEFWNERYAEETYAYGTEPNLFLREHLHLFALWSRILCLAEGEGRNAVFLGKQGFKVTAMDQSEVGRAKALKLAGQAGVTLSYDIGDLSDYDMGEGRWDGIASIWAHTPSFIRKRVIASVVAALKPGGLFLLEGYNAGQLGYGTGGLKDPDMLFSLTELESAFADFDILHAANLIRDVQEGSFHAGKSSVVQFVARK